MWSSPEASVPSMVTVNVELVELKESTGMTVVSRIRSCVSAEARGARAARTMTKPRSKQNRAQSFMCYSGKARGSTKRRTKYTKFIASEILQCGGGRSRKNSGTGSAATRRRRLSVLGQDAGDLWARGGSRVRFFAALRMIA